MSPFDPPADVAAQLEATSFGVLRALELFLRDLRDLQRAELHEAIMQAEQAVVYVRACREHLPMPPLERRVYGSPTLTFLGKVSDLTRGMGGNSPDVLGNDKESGA